MNATAAKFDFKKATASQLNDHLADLQAKAADHNTPDAELDKVHQDITATFAAIRNLKKTRSDELAGIQSKMTTFEFTIKELFGDNALTKFSDHELTLEAQHRGLFKPKAAATGETKTRKSPETRELASSKNPVLLTARKIASDHHKTTDTVLHQGRVSENGFYITAPLLRTAGKDEAATIANLMALVDPASADYVKKDDGKAEIAKIAKAVLKAKEKADKDAKDGKGGTPHNEAQADMKDKAAA